MKKMKKMKKNNKGFSLVELIIVIAIMAVLVGVLAPQFIKYVEQGRRSTDITNAENIRSAILADIADGEITGSGSGTFVNAVVAPATYASGTIGATTIATAPSVQGNVGSLNGTAFNVTWNATTGECAVSVGTGSSAYVLTTVAGADAYKAAN